MNKLIRIVPVFVIVFVISVISTTAQTISISQVKDVKPTDTYYLPLQNLIERWDAYEGYPDGTFRGDQPLTRGEFARILDRSLERVGELLQAQEIAILNQELFNSYSVNKTNITSISQVKDVRPTNQYFTVFQSLIERYGIDFCDADKYCRPDKNISEKEFYTWMGKIFNASIDGTRSATKSITRGDFVIAMSRTLDALVARIDELEKLKTAKPLAAAGTKKTVKKIDLIASLEPLGKARVINKLLSYSPDNTCLDTLHVTLDQRFAFKNGGIWGDYKIKDNDVGDIVYEAPNTCKTGEKLVLLRIGTAIVTMSEKGIKRIK